MQTIPEAILPSAFRAWRTELISGIVTDIEGTTSSIHFVKNVLFPYAARMLPDFIRAHRGEPDVRLQLDAVADESGIGRDDIDAIIAWLLTWIEVDKKATPLKTLQGMVWELGYHKGDYRAHVYDDAVISLRKWHQRGIPLYVYSSGSIQAQKLFFGYSEVGDLTALFQNYFDTTFGEKRDVASYHRIAQAAGKNAAQLLFLSDIVEELDAAREAGFQTCWVVRAQDTTATPAQLRASLHPAVNSFLEIDVG